MPSLFLVPRRHCQLLSSRYTRGCRSPRADCRARRRHPHTPGCCWGAARPRHCRPGRDDGGRRKRVGSCDCPPRDERHGHGRPTESPCRRGGRQRRQHDGLCCCHWTASEVDVAVNGSNVFVAITAIGGSLAASTTASDAVETGNASSTVSVENVAVTGPFEGLRVDAPFYNTRNVSLMSLD